ncbi:MAG: glutaredoxin family protein [Bacteroidetes bacterium]|nr:glutaredoxin family protein [Bacteroidota bacterium]
MRNLILFSKDGCELCEIAEKIILKLKSKIEFNFSIQKINEQNILFENYKFKFPVIMLNNEEVMFGRISESKLRELLLK